MKPERHKPVDEHYDEDDEGHDGGPHAHSNPRLHGEGGQAHGVVLDLAQREVEVAHLDLKHTLFKSETVSVVSSNTTETSNQKQMSSRFPHFKSGYGSIPS